MEVFEKKLQIKYNINVMIYINGEYEISDKVNRLSSGMAYILWIPHKYK